jgi:tetratricopeptide (TPR) repeat protein
MQFKYWLAALLGVASLLIVIALARNNLNRASSRINVPTSAHHQSHPVHSWEQLFEENSGLPEIVSSMLQDNFEANVDNYASLVSSIEICEKNNLKKENARLLLKKAAYTSLPKDWLLAGEATYKAALSAQDTLTRDFLMAESIAALDEVLKADPEHTNAQLYKGLALVDKRENIMQGVPLLLSVVKKEPDNLPANYTLALLATESGQFDKALLRFEKLISLQPSNVEYLYQAGNSALLSGENEKAVSYFNRCLELSKDESLRKEIKRILTNLKQ